MERLEFKNIPLTNAGIRLRFRHPVELSYDLMNEIRHQMSSKLELVRRFRFSEVPVPINTGQNPILLQFENQNQLILASTQGGTEFLISESEATVVWQNGFEPYPRFEKLNSILVDLVSIVHGVVPMIVTMHYDLTLDENSQFDDYIDLKQAGISTNDQIVDVSFATTDPNGIEYRIMVSKNDQRRPVVRTVGGVMTDKSYMDTILEIREEMNNKFQKLITDRACMEWEQK